MLNLFRRCLKRKLLSLILIGIFVEGVIGFVDITHVFGQPSISITLKWRKNASIGSTWMGPLAADLNNDGLMEIVITARGGGGGGIAALDPISGNVIWSQPYGGDHVPCEIIDLDKDGIPEILLGPQYINGSSGGVLALHGNDGSVYWYNRQAACKGTYIAVADIDADGYPEIFSATPGRITALTYDGRIFASTHTYYPCWGGMSIGDTDFDGVFEVYLAERSESYPSYPSGGRGLRAFWADNLTERWAYPDILCSSQAPVLADVDKDGDLEIIVHHQSGRPGLAVINTDGSVNTYNEVYRKQMSISDLSRGHVNPPVADVDDDGNLEIILCGDASHGTSPPNIWDLVDWKLDATLPFPSMDPGTVADIDGDGKLEIIQPNKQNVTIFKYNPATENYDIIYTIPLSMAHAFSIAQDIDGDGKLELVFDQHNSWVSVYDVDGAPDVPTPLPRSGFYFYSQYRTREAVYVPPPEQPPKIAEISPSDGATNIPVSPLQLSFKLTDYQSEPMDYTVTTNPDIGSGSGINVPNGKITIPVSDLAPSTTYTWTVTATDGTYSTTRTFTFYTEGNVVLTISYDGNGSVIKNPDSETYAYGTPVQLTAVADIGYTFSHWDGDLAWMGNNNPATILMNGNKNVTAVFSKNQYRLRTYVSPTGSGTITTIPDQSRYYYGDIVELTAVPNAGWSFSHWEIQQGGWGGDILTTNENPVTIVMDGEKRVTAVFTLGAPAVVGHVPDVDAADVSIATTVEVTFSEPMDEAATEDAFSLDSVTGSFSWNPESTVMTFTPDSSLAYGTGYTVTITTGAMDQEGQYMEALYSWSFTTELETPPAVVGHVPDVDAADVSIATTVEVTFSEPMDEAATEAAFSISPSVSGSFGWGGGDTVMTFTPSSALAYETGYTVTISSAAEDKQGENMLAPYSWGFTTEESDWQYRRTITIDRTKVNGTLTDFPVLIEILDSSLIGETQPNGYDFVFTDANNVKLDHQIEFYDSTIGHLIVWVKVPYLPSTTDTILYMYYGNPTCENQQNSTGVWDNKYMLTLHLNENTGTLYDSTINGNNGTPYKVELQGVSGKIDGAVTFDGHNRYIDIPHSDTLAGYTEALTVSFWIRLENTNKRQTILCKYDTSALRRGWMIEYDPLNRPNNPFWFFASQDGMTYSEWWASFVPQADIWYYVTVVWEANTVPKFYINGVQVATVSNPTRPSTISSIFNNVDVPLRIGRSVYSTRCLEGSLDEITISNQARSADWILTAYNNQLDPTTSYSVGTEEAFQGAYVLTVNREECGLVTITPKKTAYTQGEIMILTATPDDGYEFQVWSRDLTGTDNPAKITITKNMNITAIFAPDE
jgi:hypothetical protein